MTLSRTTSVPKLQRRMPYLFTIANTATLIGLLGTIVGLVKTFEAVGAVEGSQKQLLLSAGISTAMNTTLVVLNSNSNSEAFIAIEMAMMIRTFEIV